MKVQVLYASFMPRLFSTMMDLSFAAILLIPITRFVNRRSFINKFGDILREKNVDIDDYNALMSVLHSPEFAPYSTPSTIIELMIPMFCVQTVCFIFYFTMLWHCFGTTPIKYLMRMKVVDKVTFKKPTIFQALRRIFGTIFFPLGVWSAFFTPQKQTFHDKISGTVVIKA